MSTPLRDRIPPLVPASATRCQSCGHDHRDCDCTCRCGAGRRLAAGRSVLHFADLFCDRPPHDPHADPLHHDDEDAIWWLEDPDGRMTREEADQSERDSMNTAGEYSEDPDGR